jgi:hypothetical protein
MPSKPLDFLGPAPGSSLRLYSCNCGAAESVLKTFRIGRDGAFGLSLRLKIAFEGRDTDSIGQVIGLECGL